MSVEGLDNAHHVVLQNFEGPLLEYGPAKNVDILWLEGPTNHKSW